MGRIRLSRVTPTVDTAAYADADQVTGLMTFTGILSPERRGLVKSVVMIYESGTVAAMNLHLFRASVTIASTINNALNISDADMTAYYVGTVNIPSTNNTNTEALSANAVQYRHLVDLAVESTDGNLYGVLEATAAVTFTAADDLTIVLGVEAMA